ncbi:acetoacetate--CoA ligase [Seohaeicola zhoushanensis]|uniref:Acetoacetyl-CoA synthetase n=1 Tax=Seohaeicola zhoushanensis TaxID=1569283 RepID=A0A8J3GZX7_9RHOB|nr:acetoacetate--CoA ligase [Seohaeicola zhoushanensis]GHF58513.1 acetoacetyl-CoA synthetase [Seohaeicola zhoushanensis]
MSGRQILWTPSPERAAASTLSAYMRWLAERGLPFDSYQALWDWSVTDLDAFWRSIWEYFGIGAPEEVGTVLAERKMPGAVWFPGVSLNFAEVVLREGAKTPDRVALSVRSETFGDKDLTWAQLRQQVANVAARLKAMGVGQGDRVVAILPNTEAAIIACLATASLGAIWSLCAPDMGHVAIIDRFRQIEPKVLIAQDGYVHAGKDIDRRAVLETILAGLPTVEHRVWIPVAGALPEGAVVWEEMIAGSEEFQPVKVAFDQPLWIVYSSGTTGNPKPIVHGQGGIVVESAKQSLHQDFTAADTYCWMTSSGWIMWNSQFTALARGATVALFDSAPNQPDLLALWRFAAERRVTYLGAGAAFYATCLKAGIRPRDAVDLTALRSIAATGSPLSEDAYRWIYDAVKPDVWLAPISGGTDLAGAFVGGNPLMPVRMGEMQCRFLGNAVRAYDEEGHELIDKVGELVCTEPLPSMPLYFWGDTDGRRLHESYFDTYPGIWRHGDWIEFTPEGGSVIYGRSDATINRKGLRMGSAEIYQAVEGLEEVMDSLVIDLEFLGRESFMPLFVVLAAGVVLDDALKAKINDAIRTAVSARFIPNEIVQIAEVPRTLSGKKLEVPVKKLLLGGDPAKVVNRDSMSNPGSFDTFVAYAEEREKDRING